MNPVVKVQRMQGSDTALPLPGYQSDGAAGMDICANLKQGRFTLKPNQRILVPTGLRFEIPDGYEGQIRPRSGLALKQGITLVNAPGTIDSDYRGEIGVILINLGELDVEIVHGQRIAQMVIAPVTRCEVIEVEDISDTGRGAGGFGSTGG